MKENITTIEVLFVPIDSVEPNPFNPNIMDEEKRLELKRLMATTDARTFFAKDPLRVSPYNVFYGKAFETEKPDSDRFVFIDGFHRWLNAKELGWMEIGITIDKITLFQARQESYSRNYLRGNIDPIKEAKLFQDEVNDGLSREKIAEKYFKDPSYISRSLSLLSLSEEILTFLNPQEERDRPLTKSHLEHLVGIPEDEAINLARWASQGLWSAKEMERRAYDARERIEREKHREEAISHFTMRECPVCGTAGSLDNDMKTMHCGKNYSHYELNLRQSLQWGPLDTKEGILKRKFKLDDGRSLPLEDIIKSNKNKKKESLRRKPDWFKHEKSITELMPKIHAYAYEMLLANRPNIEIDQIQVSGRTKATDREPKGGFFNLSTNDNGLWIHIDDKELSISFEKKEWKRGNFKTRVNVRGVKEETGLKQVQVFLDKLMRGEAKVEDYPFDARIKQ